MVKHRKLDYDIYRSFTKIANLEIVYLVRKKLVIFEQVKIGFQRTLVHYALYHCLETFLRLVVAIFQSKK